MCPPIPSGCARSRCVTELEPAAALPIMTAVVKISQWQGSAMGAARRPTRGDAGSGARAYPRGCDCAATWRASLKRGSKHRAPLLEVCVFARGGALVLCLEPLAVGFFQALLVDPWRVTVALSKKLSKAELKDFEQALREVSEVDEALLSKVAVKDHYEVLTATGGQRTLAKLFPKRVTLFNALAKGSSLVFDEVELQLMTLELYGDLLREAAYPLLRRWVTRAKRYDSGAQSALRGLSFSTHREDAKLILSTLKRFAPTKPKAGRMSARDAYLFSPGAVSLERLEVPGLDRLIFCLALLTHHECGVWPDLGRLARNAKSQDVSRILGEYTSKCRVADAVREYLPRAVELGYMEHVAAAVLDLPDGHAVFEGATRELEAPVRIEWEITLLHHLCEQEDFHALIDGEPRWVAIAERLAKLDREATEGRAQLKAVRVLERAKQELG